MQVVLDLFKNGRQLAQGLHIKPRLHAHRRHAHLALEFRLRHQRGDGIDHDHIQRVRARQRFANGQRFLAAVRLETNRSSRFTPSFFA